MVSAADNMSRVLIIGVVRPDFMTGSMRRAT